MHCKRSLSYSLQTLWLASKIFRHLSEGLFVEQQGVDRIKSLLSDNQKVVLVPQYKSFADFFILMYTLACNKIDLPFVVGNKEDTPRITYVDSLLRGCGYIRAKRSRDQSRQESYLTQALIREILAAENLLVVFQNEERMQNGRFNQPTVADLSLEWLI